jgi:hypothetical protein
MIGGRSTTNMSIEIYTQDPRWNNYSSWRNLLKLPPPTHNLQAVQQFWTEALIILDNAEVGTVQHLAQDLTSRNFFGYQYIEAVLDISHTQHSVLEYSQSFLLLISHKALLDCMSIESNVNDLYRIVDGKRRERIVAFLIQICSDLLAKCEAKSCSGEALLAATTTALCEAVNHDQQVIFNDKIPDLLVMIERIIFQAKIPEESKSYYLVMNRLQRLQRTLCRLKSSADTKFTATLKQHDRLDITKVKILPTYADIGGTALKAVPSISFTPAGVEGLLDFHFRLLRHDSLGTVESQLTRLVRALRNDPHVGLNSSEHLELVKQGFFIYNNVYVRKVLFNQHCGLGAQLGFRQPQRFGNQYRSEEEFWGRKRRPMQLGSLICLVTTHPKLRSIVFFTISAIKGSPGISLDNQHVTVTARVIKEESQKRVDHLL